MKRLVSLLLSALVLASAFCMRSNAGGALIFRDDFDGGILPENWSQNSFFHLTLGDGNGVCAGYRDAVFLQSNCDFASDPKMWDKFYVSADICVRDIDLYDTDTSDTVGIGLRYRDAFKSGYTDGSGAESGPIYTYFIDILNSVATLDKSGHEFVYTDDDGQIKTGSTPDVRLATVEIKSLFSFVEWETETWFNMGMRVTDGKIECYLDGERILSCFADDATERVGPWNVDAVDETVGTYRSEIQMFNSKLCLYIDNFEVWEPGYADDFKCLVYGDADYDGAVTADDVVVMLRAIAGWDTGNMEGGFDADCADVDLDGEVTLRDAVLVMQHLAGWRVTLGQEQ